MNQAELNQAKEAWNNAIADVEGFTTGSQFYGAFQGCDKHQYERDSLQGEIYISSFLRNLNIKFPSGVVQTDQAGIIK
jgi:hypothetical protein